MTPGQMVRVGSGRRRFAPRATKRPSKLDSDPSGAERPLGEETEPVLQGNVDRTLESKEGPGRRRCAL